jgi:hypothetical protein
MELVGVLAGTRRVAIIGRTTARSGDRHIVNDFIDVLRIENSPVAEVWQYHWDQVCSRSGSVQ